MQQLRNTTHIHQGLGVHNAKHQHTPKVPELGIFPGFQLEALAALGYAVSIPLLLSLLLFLWWRSYGRAAHRRMLYRDAVAYDDAVEKLAMIARQQHLASEEGGPSSAARREQHRAMTHAAPFFEHVARPHRPIYSSPSSSSALSSPQELGHHSRHSTQTSSSAVRLLRDDVPRELVNDHSAGPRPMRTHAQTASLGRRPSFKYRGRDEQQNWANNPADRNRHIPRQRNASIAMRDASFERRKTSLQRNASLRSTHSVSTLRGVSTVRGAPRHSPMHSRDESMVGVPAALRSSLVDTSAGLQRSTSTKRSPMPPSARNQVYERAVHNAAASSSQVTLTGPSPSKSSLEWSPQHRQAILPPVALHNPWPQPQSTDGQQAATAAAPRWRGFGSIKSRGGGGDSDAGCVVQMHGDVEMSNVRDTSDRTLRRGPELHFTSAAASHHHVNGSTSPVASQVDLGLADMSYGHDMVHTDSLARPQPLYARRSSAGSSGTEGTGAGTASPSLLPLAPYLSSGGTSEWGSPLPSPGQSIDVARPVVDTQPVDRRPYIQQASDQKFNFL